jgi:L-amino acid N-acyltransferase YncA
MAKLVLYDRNRVAYWVAQRIGQVVPWEGFNAFGVESEGEIVAGVVIHNINSSNAYCHIAIDKPSKAVFELFRQLGLKRLTGVVPTDRPEVIKFDKKLGFEEEFVMKDAADNADMMFLVIWADKCRWLPKG